MQLQPFILLHEGCKRVELRVNDPKRQQLRVGDTITFICVDDTDQSMTKTITELLTAPDFESLLSQIPLELLDNTRIASVDEEITLAASYYDPVEMVRYGVVGIVLE